MNGVHSAIEFLYVVVTFVNKIKYYDGSVS